MKILLAQLNPTVGDIEGNARRLLRIASDWQGKVDLVVAPELYLVGYPPRDLLAEPWFIDQAEREVQKIIAESAKLAGTGILFGAPVRTRQKTGLGLYNAALLVADGKLAFTQCKSLLPTYDVFDEARYFDEATKTNTLCFKGVNLGISICEDAWNDPELWQKRIYPHDPIADLAAQGAQLMINISASPYYLGKEAIRYRLIQNHSQKHRVPFLFVNQIGGNDELIFDGRSLAFDHEGRPVGFLAAFQEELRLVDTEHLTNHLEFAEQDRIEALHQALVLGVSDYMRKCGFGTAVIGLSGGIDSAVVCALAAAAIGPENVLGIAMPSRYSAGASETLARDLATNLGVRFKTVAIGPIYDAYVCHLGKELGIATGDVNLTLENIQARVRGNILMAYSNQTGALVLSTGNKSEIGTGYCTLYGDMAGGLAAISDVPKTMVYDLARYINREQELIPTGIITRPPTAELRPNQLDQDTLPPYEVLDRILHEYIENHCSREQIIAQGFDAATVSWVLRAVNRNEYKRRQSAPGLKVTTRAFGIGRRMPIAAKYES